jgi:lipopolysaccharide/colanic/teichoic acid biosynthesis glycosyltransferase
VHSVPPGITDPASIKFRNENELLSMVDDPEHEYVTNILPRKIEIYTQYVADRSLWMDLKIILRTLGLLGR